MRQLAEVDALPAPTRGAEFETLVVRLFEVAQFVVTRDAGSARPRQTDLIARLGRDRYLVEVKHRARPADIDVIDGIRSRLERIVSRVLGVVVSRSGFTSPAVEETERRRERPVLLLDGEDIAHLVTDPESLRDLLQQRYENLVTHGRRVREQHETRRRPRSLLNARPSVGLVGLDGKGRSWMPASGGFGTGVNALELLDVDWTPTPGFGVALDVRVPCDNLDGLEAIFERLAAAGWISDTGAWTIEQSERSWHGLGAPTLLQAVRAWRERFGQLGYVHHREIASYSDQRDVCAWTLQADLEARAPRQVWGCSMSFQFPGIPLDPEPLRSLLGSIRVTADRQHFRPRGSASVESWGGSNPRGRVLEITGYVVERRRGELWVRGLQVRNPFRTRTPRALPHEVGQPSHLVVGLRSWHPWGDRPAAYRLLRIEWMRSTDMCVICAAADWDDPLEQGGPSPT